MHGHMATCRIKLNQGYFRAAGRRVRVGGDWGATGFGMDGGDETEGA